MSKAEPRANLRDYVLNAIDAVVRKAQVMSCKYERERVSPLRDLPTRLPMLISFPRPCSHPLRSCPSPSRFCSSSSLRPRRSTSPRPNRHSSRCFRRGPKCLSNRIPWHSPLVVSLPCVYPRRNQHFFVNTKARLSLHLVECLCGREDAFDPISTSSVTL